MDPNSGNQTWSYWRFEVTPGGTKRPPYRDVREAAATFARLTYGAAAEMRITETYVAGRRVFVIENRVEGVPVNDPQYVDWITKEWIRWAYRGFGIGTTVARRAATLQAGSRQDGTPRDQLIILESALQIPIRRPPCPTNAGTSAVAAGSISQRRRRTSRS